MAATKMADDTDVKGREITHEEAADIMIRMSQVMEGIKLRDVMTICGTLAATAALEAVGDETLATLILGEIVGGTQDPRGGGLPSRGSRPDRRRTRGRPGPAPTATRTTNGNKLR